MPQKIILDLDDYCDDWNVLPELLEAKKSLPGLRANLFTVPGRISEELFEETLKHDWIQMIPHGWLHASNYEFAIITRSAMEKYLNSLDERYVRGFKAPGWQISTDAMKVLRDHGYWIMVQWSDGRDNGRSDGPYQPAVISGLKYYSFNEVVGYRPIHGHTREVCKNGPSVIFPLLSKLSADSEFAFIDDYIKESSPCEKMNAA